MDMINETTRLERLASQYADACQKLGFKRKAKEEALEAYEMAVTLLRQSKAALDAAVAEMHPGEDLQGDSGLYAPDIE